MYEYRRRPAARAALCAMALAGICLSCKTARAEVETESRDGELFYDFRDADRLGAAGSSPYGSMFKERILKHSRVLLIRPRVTFVPELLESVETI